MKKMKIKNILIVMLIAIEVVATYFMYKSSTNKEVVLDNVELKELTDKSSFAIYLDGKEYTTSTTWPASATFEKAECQNEKGDIVTGVLTFNESENKAYLNNITQTTYCYLYFTTKTQVAPTCTLSVSSSGVTLNANNATEYGLVSDQINIPIDYVTKTYNSKKTLALEAYQSYFGFVKNSGGEAYCAINVWGLGTAKGTCTYSSGGGGSSSGGGTVLYTEDTCQRYSSGCCASCSCTLCATIECTAYCSDGNTYHVSGSERSTCLETVRAQCTGSSSSSGPVGWICGYDGSIKGNYTSQTECEEKCVFGETSCSGGSQVTSGGNIYCWNSRT